MTIAAGTRLGRYEIRSQIGAGGMGEVYLANDNELDRAVAIKILPEAVASDTQRLQRFIREAKSASALNHPHILTIHEIGSVDNIRFIATEFIDGQTLRQRITEGVKLVDVLEISTQIAGALAAAPGASGASGASAPTLPKVVPPPAPLPGGGAAKKKKEGC